MVSLFKDKTTTGVFRLILLSVVVHIRFFIHSPMVVLPEDNLLLAPLLNNLSVLPTLVLAMIYHGIVVIQALRLNYILGNYKLFPHSNFTVAMCYILFTGLIPSWCNITAALVINILIIWLIHLLCQLYHSTKPGASVINIGLVAGSAGLLYPPSFLLILIILLGVLIIRPFRFTLVITYIIGVTIPLYFLGTYLFLHDMLPGIGQYLPKISIHQPSQSENKGTFIASLSLIGICLISGFSYLQAGMHKLLILARKTWIILMIMVVLFLPAIFLLNNQLWPILLLTMPAAAALSGNLFYYNQKKILLSVIFWLFIFASWFFSFNGWELIIKK